MPNKYLNAEESLIGVGSLLLEHLGREQTLSSLWDKVKQSPRTGTFERFILGLDFLYLLGTIDIKGNRIIRMAQGAPS